MSHSSFFYAPQHLYIRINTKIIADIFGLVRIKKSIFKPLI